MAVKTYKPITPGLRARATRDYAHLTTDESLKALTKGKNRINGRRGSGQITMRRRGGGAKRLYRIVDFRRNKYDIKAKVAHIAYDPNRSADICLLHYLDGEKRYMLAPRGIRVGDFVISGEKVEPKLGNSMYMGNMPLGTVIHNVELALSAGGVFARSAGSFATLVAKDGDYVTIKLPSGEMRMIFHKCSATVGSVGGEDYFNTSLGKAGIARIKGRRPKVRGVAMNPCDHPHGGGEGRTSGGRHPVSPQGLLAKGYKTRNKRKTSSKFIVKRRGT